MKQTNNTRFSPYSMTKRLNDATHQAINANRIVGSTVMVAYQGEIIYQQALGMSNREKSKPMTLDTIFLYASLTKPIVSVTAMRLIEEGVIALHDPVTKWFPTFKPCFEKGMVPEITVHHLLTHTAGLSYGFWEPNGKGSYRNAGISDGLDMPGMSLEENMQRLVQIPLLFPPGSSWLYSIGMDILGGVMEHATGLSLPELVKIYVTDPLNLKDTGFLITDLNRFFTPYQDGKNVPVKMNEFAQASLPETFGGGIVNYAPQRIFDKASYPSGGAGMAGTAPDFMQFLLTMPQLLKPETLKAMMSPQVSAQAQTQGPGWGFGYGWSVLETPKLTQTPQSKGTIQWGGVYGHSWFVDPVEDLIVVALTNTALEGLLGAYPMEIRDAVYDHKFKI